MLSVVAYVVVGCVQLKINVRRKLTKIFQN